MNLSDLSNRLKRKADDIRKLHMPPKKHDGHRK